MRLFYHHSLTYICVQKSDRLMKTLAGEGATLNEVEHMTAIQALLIYNAHSFLSLEPSDRLINELCLGAIAKASHLSLDATCEITPVVTSLYVRLDCSIRTETSPLGRLRQTGDAGSNLKDFVGMTFLQLHNEHWSH